MYLHAFSIADNGLLANLYSFSFYFIILLTFGLETAFFHFAERRLDADKAYANGFIVILALNGVFLLAGAAGHSLLAEGMGCAHSPQLVFVWLGIVAADTLAALPMARLRRQEAATRFAIISLANIGLTVALNLYFVLQLGWGVESVFLANFIASVAKLGMALVQNLPDTQLFEADAARPMALYGLYIMIAGLLGAMNEHLDKNLTPRLWPDEQEYKGTAYTGMELNGVYAAMYKLGMFVALITQAFRYAAEPLFFRHGG